MKKKIKYLIILLLLVVTTGCTTYLKNKDGKPVTNPTTGQSLAENILCRPTDEETIKLYEDNNYDLSKLPYCVCKSDKVIEKIKVENKKETIEKNKDENSKKEKSKEKEEIKEEEKKETDEIVYEEVEKDCEEFKVTSGGYEGLWSAIFGVSEICWIMPAGRRPTVSCLYRVLRFMAKRQECSSESGSSL